MSKIKKEIKKNEMIKINGKMCYTCTFYHDNSCNYSILKDIIGCIQYKRVELP